MNYLLDTHTFLWFIDSAPPLSNDAKALIENSANIIYLSTASLWEMAIKVSLDKLKMPAPFTSFINQQLYENDIRLLKITPKHAGIVVTLPFHHRDPFDRLIIAQSKAEDIPIIGKDVIFDRYGITRHW